MMGRLEACLIEARKKAGLDPQQELELREKVKGYERAIGRQNPGSAEKARAAAEALAIQDRLRELRRARINAQLQAIVFSRNVDAASLHPKGFRSGLNSILAGIDTRRRVLRARAETDLAEFLADTRTRRLGFVQDTRLVEDILRELHGTDTGSAVAKRHAEAFSTAARRLAVAFNEAGGDIRFRADWGSPQTHDHLAVAEAGRAAWRDFIAPLLDRERSFAADGAPLDDLEFQTAIDQTFETIATAGLSKIEPGKVPRGASLANRRRDPRQLVFRDGDAWVAYQKRFGQPDLHGGLLSHIDRMAREVATLELMGPNPRHNFEALRLEAERRSLGTGRDQVGLQYTDALWKGVSGARDESPSGFLHELFATARIAITGARLGTATVSAITDVAFMDSTAHFWGMPSTRVLRTHLELLKPGSLDDKVRLARLGLGAEGLAAHNLGVSRFGGELAAFQSRAGSPAARAARSTARGIARTTDATMRASGLNHWTEAVRYAMGSELLGFLADHARLDFDALPAELRRGLGQYGIGPEEWRIMRAAQLETLPWTNGASATYMRPENVAGMSQDAAAAAGIGDTSPRRRLEVANKFSGMLLREMDHASPTPNAEVRAIMQMGTESGTLWGELARSALLFKSFPLSVMLMHFGRASRMGTRAEAGRYVARLALFGTMLGAVAIQARQVIMGKDPRDMQDPRFWGAAAVQGGGLGLLGDFLYQDVNRFGHGFVVSNLGPLVGLADDSVKLTWGNFLQLAKGEETDFADEAIRFVGSYTPGTSLWYTRLALERFVINEAQKLAGTNADRSFQTTIERTRKDWGQGYWWPPGKRAPGRLPALP